MKEWDLAAWDCQLYHSRKWCNKSIIDQACLVKIAELDRCAYKSGLSQSINILTKLKILANIQPFWPPTWSMAHILMGMQTPFFPRFPFVASLQSHDLNLPVKSVSYSLTFPIPSYSFHSWHSVLFILTEVSHSLVNRQEKCVHLPDYRAIYLWNTLHLTRAVSSWGELVIVKKRHTACSDLDPAQPRWDIASLISVLFNGL